MELPYGIQSHDTFDRIFERMNSQELQDSFKKWISSVAKQTKGQVVAIDGKTLRCSYNKSEDKKAIHMISAWASEKQVVLGQLKTEEKSNENPGQKRFSMPWAHPQANSKLSWLLLLGGGDPG